MAVAMSGGLDSSMAAALLLQEGYEVFGLTMRLWGEDASRSSPASVAAAGEAARHLGIPLHVIDLRENFRRQVMDYLVDEYCRGRTPNPCVVCNQSIKFGRLLEEARRAGACALATGHYARRAWYDGRWHLLRGIDARKDQSYALYRLGQAQLAQILFPLGNLTKEKVRGMALERRLPAADRQESQEICFLPDNDYRQFIRECAPEHIRPGPILDRGGQELGKHHGLPYYTIGQRKGLGIAAPEPLYVLELDVPRNTVIVGPARELGSRRTNVEKLHFISACPSQNPFQATAKIRYKAVEDQVDVYPLDATNAVVHFGRLQRDITSGQSIVFYNKEEVIGGGVIASPG